MLTFLGLLLLMVNLGVARQQQNRNQSCGFDLQGEPAQPIIPGPDDIVPLVYVVEQPDSPIEVVSVDLQGMWFSVSNDRYTYKTCAKYEVRNRNNRVIQGFAYRQTLLPGRREGGVTGGVAGGVSGGRNGGPFGVPSGGMTGGISGARAIRSAASQKIPDVDYSTVWIDTVRRGTFYRVVSGLGSLVRAENSTNLVARVILPASTVSEVRPNQTVTFNTRRDLMKGHVIGLNAPSSDETRTVYIGLDGPLPEWAVADLPVEARIDIEKIDNTLYVGRPSNVPENSAAASISASLFKVATDGKGADRVIVKFGRPSVNTIEVLDGLQAGDKVILSDMSAFGNHIHFIKPMHPEKH